MDAVDLRLDWSVSICLFLIFQQSQQQVLELIAPTTLIGQMERLKQLSFTFFY